MSLGILLMDAGVMYMKAPDTLLTISQVKQWQDRIVEIGTIMQELQKELASLTPRVEAAKLFMVDMPESSGETIVEQRSPEPDGQDAAEIVVATLKSIGGQGRPATIKDRMAQAPADSYASKLAVSPYFYTVLMRLTRANRLIKEGGRYRLSTSSAQAEAGGVAPPAGSVA